MYIYDNKKLSLLETTVKYLREELGLRYCAIGKLLNRDERTIWVTYSKSKLKSPSKLKIRESILLPIDVLTNRRYSMMELVVGYLHEEFGLKFSVIARMLVRVQRTIWTCYSRLKRKREGENEAR